MRRRDNGKCRTNRRSSSEINSDIPSSSNNLSNCKSHSSNISRLGWVTSKRTSGISSSNIRHKPGAK